MGKKKKATKQAGENQDLLDDMPIAKAIYENDAVTLAMILKSLLPAASKVSEVKIEQSVGESFTGGRSTPVYFIECMVQRPGSEQPKQRSFVAKLILMPGEGSSVDHKRESYAVERRFYEYLASRVALPIPRLLASDRDGNKPWPAICFLMNDVSKRFPCHPEFLSVGQAKRALKWLANFHVCFWEDKADPKKHVWDRGGFWTRSTGDASGISSQWSLTLRWLEKNRPGIDTPGIKSLGQRLERAAPAVSSYLQQKSNTLIHGDFKAANLFLAESGDDSQSVAVVDFQYTGGGVCAEDVAYLLYPDARGDFFDNEDELLKVYYDELIEQLMIQCKGGPSSLSFGTFRKQYELARLDLTRHWLRPCKGWVASTSGEIELINRLERALRGIDDGQILLDYSSVVESFCKSN